MGETPGSGVRLKTDIVVIGAGQAGLSSAYHLKRRGLPPNRGFVILDQSPNAGGAWRFRWHALTLSTVNPIPSAFADASAPAGRRTYPG